MAVTESRDFVSISRPVFWSLGLEGLRARLGLGLELFVSRLFLMKFCKEFLKKNV